MSLESSAFVTYPVHVLLLMLSKVYKVRLLQKWHNLVEFLPVETKNSEGMRKVEIEVPRESVHGSSTSQALDAEKLILVMFRTERSGVEDV